MKKSSKPGHDGLPERRPGCVAPIFKPWRDPASAAKSFASSCAKATEDKSAEQAALYRVRMVSKL